MLLWESSRAKTIMACVNCFLIIEECSRCIVISEYTKFPLAPMGVLTPGSAHARPSAQPPIDMSGNFPAHVSAVTFKIFKKKLKKTKNRPPGGQGVGVRINFFYPNFCLYYLGAHAKI